MLGCGKTQGCVRVCVCVGVAACVRQHMCVGDSVDGPGIGRVLGLCGERLPPASLSMRPADLFIVASDGFHKPNGTDTPLMI